MKNETLSKPQSFHFQLRTGKTDDVPEHVVRAHDRIVRLGYAIDERGFYGCRYGRESIVLELTPEGVAVAYYADRLGRVKGSEAFAVLPAEEQRAQADARAALLDWTDEITGEDMLEAYDRELDAADEADAIAARMFGGEA